MSSVLFSVTDYLRNERSILPIKHRSSRSCHIYKVFLAVPEDLEVAAEEFDGDWFAFVNESVQGGGYGYGAGTGAAGEGFAGATVPRHASEVCGGQ